MGDNQDPEHGWRLVISGWTCAGVFSGVALIEHAARLLGGDIRWTCEIEPYCQKVISKRFPGVPIYSDVREIGREVITLHGPIDVLVGGFP